MINNFKVGLRLGIVLLIALLIVLLGVSLQACNASNDATPALVIPIAHPATSETRKVAVTGHEKNTSQAQIKYLMGKFSPSKHKFFVKIPKRYANQSGFYLRKEALEAFIKMHQAAKSDGVHLTIRSATRNFNAQKRIWERKWLGKRRLSDGTNVARDIRKSVDKSLKILQYSSMPGTSRHHWGTDIDLNSFNNKWFESGKGLKLFNWLNVNAGNFGFCRPYTTNRQFGYNEEKWHWSFKPLSAPMMKAASQVLSDAQITGFLGSETATQIGVVKKYILGVGAGCR